MCESPPEKGREILILIKSGGEENAKENCCPKEKKIRKYLNFKIQDKMIYFPVCEKLAKNKLLTFKSGLLK